MPSIRIKLAIVLGLVAIGGAALAGPHAHFGGISGGSAVSSEGAANRMLEMFDTDKSGGLGSDEILSEQARLFTAIDINGDGLLSVDEFRRRGRLLQAIGATSIFEMLDTNGDQILDKSEIGATVAALVCAL